MPRANSNQCFAGATTNMSVKNMDSSESVVHKTLNAFDQGKHVVYPTRISVRLGMLLPRFLSRSPVTKIAGMANKKRRAFMALIVEDAPAMLGPNVTLIPSTNPPRTNWHKIASSVIRCRWSNLS